MHPTQAASNHQMSFNESIKGLVLIDLSDGELLVKVTELLEAEIGLGRTNEHTRGLTRYTEGRVLFHWDVMDSEGHEHRWVIRLRLTEHGTFQYGLSGTGQSGVTTFTQDTFDQAMADLLAVTGHLSITSPLMHGILRNITEIAAHDCGQASVGAMDFLPIPLGNGSPATMKVTATITAENQDAREYKYYVSDHPWGLVYGPSGGGVTVPSKLQASVDRDIHWADTALRTRLDDLSLDDRTDDTIIEILTEALDTSFCPTAPCYRIYNSAITRKADRVSFECKIRWKQCHVDYSIDLGASEVVLDTVGTFDGKLYNQLLAIELLNTDAPGIGTRTWFDSVTHSVVASLNEAGCAADVTDFDLHKMSNGQIQVLTGFQLAEGHHIHLCYLDIDYSFVTDREGSRIIPIVLTKPGLKDSSDNDIRLAVVCDLCKNWDEAGNLSKVKNSRIISRTETSCIFLGEDHWPGDPRTMVIKVQLDSESFTPETTDMTTIYPPKYPDMTLLDPEQLHPTGRDVVHLAFYATDHQGDKHTFVIVRKDGTLGLPGGKVDPGEGLLDALVREVKEEINWSLTASNCTCLASHSMASEDIHAHLYVCEVGMDILSTIQIFAYNGSHYSKELAGSMTLQIEALSTKYAAVPMSGTMPAQVELLLGL